MIFNVLLGIFVFYVVPMMFLKFIAGFAEESSGKHAEPGSLLDIAYVPVMNLIVGILYKHSDPADPETIGNFKALNRVRNTLRELKRRRNMLANIQKSLKIAVKA